MTDEASELTPLCVSLSHAVSLPPLLALCKVCVHQPVHSPENTYGTRKTAARSTVIISAKPNPSPSCQASLIACKNETVVFSAR